MAVYDYDEDVVEPSTRVNHELRNEFFSREGVSLTIAARGTNVQELVKQQRQEHVVEGAYEELKKKEEKSKEGGVN